MRTRIFKWLVVGVLTLAVVQIAVVMLFRVKPRRMMGTTRRFNRRVLNPMIIRHAGRSGDAAGVIHHTGRRTRTPYSTPVLTLPVADGYLIPLPYGRQTDWLANLESAGAAVLEVDGRTINVEDPDVVAAAVAEPRIPAGYRRRFRVYGVDEYLHLREVQVPTSVPPT